MIECKSDWIMNHVQTILSTFDHQSLLHTPTEILLRQHFRIGRTEVLYQANLHKMFPYEKYSCLYSRQLDPARENSFIVSFKNTELDMFVCISTF